MVNKKLFQSYSQYFLSETAIIDRQETEIMKMYAYLLMLKHLPTQIHSMFYKRHPIRDIVLILERLRDRL